MVDSSFLKFMKSSSSLSLDTRSINSQARSLEADLTSSSEVISSNFYKAGTHLGHKSIPLTEVKSWHSSMASYNLGIRDNITICNIQQTQKALSRAFYVITQILENGGNILIVNTNPEFYKLSINSMKFMEKNLPSSSFLQVSYCFYKWIGGTLTNYKQISKSIYCYLKFSQRCGKFCEKYNIDFVRYQKIKKCFQGYGFIRKDTMNRDFIVMSLQKKPDIIFIFNPGDNKNLIREANRLQIPIIACTDTSISLNTTKITYPIPCNNTSVDFILYIYKKLYRVFASISLKN